jgi:hypothetical protein
MTSTSPTEPPDQNHLPPPSRQQSSNPPLPIPEVAIPSAAYRQPSDLIYCRGPDKKIDKDVLNMHMFGYQDDPLPDKNGVHEIGTIVKMLADADMPCCMVAEPALLYYGTTRVMKVGSGSGILPGQILTSYFRTGTFACLRTCTRRRLTL